MRTKFIIFLILGLIVIATLILLKVPVTNQNSDNQLLGESSITLWKLLANKLQPVMSSWVVYAPGNLQFDGEVQPDGSTCSNGQILKKTGANDWDCATDAGGVSSNSLDFDEFVNSMTLDANLTIASAGYTFGFNSGSKVGIGTTSPTEALHVVVAPAGEEMALFRNNGSLVDLTIDSLTSGVAIRAGGGDGLSLGANAIDDYITIDDTGFVGIGTSTPTTKLEVQGTASASYLLTGNTLQVGGYSSTAYSRFGTSTTTHSNYISAANDVLVSGDLQVIGTGSFNIASASQYWSGGLVDCDNTTTSKLLWSDTGVFSCGTDQNTGTGGGILGIQVKETGVFIDTIVSMSFDPAHFVLTASGTEDVSIKLDWGAGGPASLSEAETITGNWINTANPWADNEVVDTLTINGGTVTWTDLTSYPTGCTNQFVTTVGDTLTCASVDISAMTNLSVTSPLTLTGDVLGLASNSLDWDEIVDSMTLDANTSIASAGYTFTWGSGTRVGIGTTTPATNKLLTVGNGADAFSATANGIGVNFNGGAGIFMRDSTNNVEGKYEVFNSRLGLGTITAHAVDLWSNNTQRLTILSTGEIGIGDTTPTTNLDVAGSASISGNFELTSATAKLGINAGTIIDTMMEVGGTASISSFALTDSATSIAMVDCDGDTQALGWDITSKRFFCGDDDSGGGVASDSLGFGALVNPLTLDTNISIASAGFRWNFNDIQVGFNAGGVIDTLLEIGGVGSGSNASLFSAASISLAFIDLLQSGGFHEFADYSRFGRNDTGHSLAASDDLLVSGLFEVDDNVFFDLQLTVTDKAWFSLTVSVANNFEVGNTAFLVDTTLVAPDILLQVTSSSQTTLFKIASSGHEVFDHDSTPAISACGTTPAIQGNDNVGVIVAGTGTVTSCTVTFIKPWSVNAPACIVQNGSAAEVLVPSTTVTQLVITGTGMNSDTIFYRCAGYE